MDTIFIQNKTGNYLTNYVKTLVSECTITDNTIKCQQWLLDNSSKEVFGEIGKSFGDFILHRDRLFSSYDTLIIFKIFFVNFIDNPEELRLRYVVGKNGLLYCKIENLLTTIQKEAVLLDYYFLVDDMVAFILAQCGSDMLLTEEYIQVGPLAAILDQLYRSSQVEDSSLLDELVRVINQGKMTDIQNDNDNSGVSIEQKLLTYDFNLNYVVGDGEDAEAYVLYDTETMFHPKFTFQIGYTDAELSNMYIQKLIKLKQISNKIQHIDDCTYPMMLAYSGTSVMTGITRLEEIIKETGIHDQWLGQQFYYLPTYNGASYITSGVIDQSLYSIVRSIYKIYNHGNVTPLLLTMINNITRKIVLATYCGNNDLVGMIEKIPLDLVNFDPLIIQYVYKQITNIFSAYSGASFRCDYVLEGLNIIDRFQIVAPVVRYQDTNLLSVDIHDLIGIKAENLEMTFFLPEQLVYIVEYLDKMHAFRYRNKGFMVWSPDKDRNDYFFSNTYFNILTSIEGYGMSQKTFTNSKQTRKHLETVLRSDYKVCEEMGYYIDYSDRSVNVQLYEFEYMVESDDDWSDVSTARRRYRTDHDVIDMRKSRLIESVWSTLGDKDSDNYHKFSDIPVIFVLSGVCCVIPRLRKSISLYLESLGIAFAQEEKNSGLFQLAKIFYKDYSGYKKGGYIQDVEIEKVVTPNMIRSGLV